MSDHFRGGEKPKEYRVTKRLVEDFISMGAVHGYTSEEVAQTLLENTPFDEVFIRDKVKLYFLESRGQPVEVAGKIFPSILQASAGTGLSRRSIENMLDMGKARRLSHI